MQCLIWQQVVLKLVTSKEQILQSYPDVFDGIGYFPGPPYHIQLDPNVIPKQNPCQPIPVHLKEALKQEIDKMLKVGVLKSVHEATPWINSFVLIVGKEKFANLRLRICLAPTNLNKAIVHEPYHFKTPEDITHLLAGSMYYDCLLVIRKGIGTSNYEEASFICNNL